MQKVVDVAGIFSWEVTMVKLIKGESDLATLHPDLVKEWHPIKNGDLMPEDISSGSGKEVWWLCPEGHTYSMVVNQRTKRGYGCPYCSGHRAIRGRTDILGYLSEIKNSLADIRPDVVKCWDFSKNGKLTPNMFTVGSNQAVWWKCPDCGHEWQCSINSMTRPGRYGCMECSKEKRGKSFTKQAVKRVGALAETMPDLAKEWHPTKNGTLSPNDISAGRFKPVWWLCSQCGHEWQASPNNRKKGVGCPCCSGRVPKIGVNDLATLYPELLEEWDCSQNKDLDPGQLLPGSGKKAWWKCSQCGYEWQTGIASRTKGHGCPKCSKRKKNNPS